MCAFRCLHRNKAALNVDGIVCRTKVTKTSPGGANSGFALGYIGILWVVNNTKNRFYLLYVCTIYRFIQNFMAFSVLFVAYNLPFLLINPLQTSLKPSIYHSPWQSSLKSVKCQISLRFKYGLRYKYYRKELK